MKPIIQIPEYPHAILSPSKAAQWINCRGSVGASKGVPNKTSRYAAEGTAYHDVARRALIEDKDCVAYVGDRYKVGEFEFTVDEDNAEQAQKYVDQVRAIPGKRMVEVDLYYHHLLGLPKEQLLDDGSLLPIASGTGDAVILDYENRIIWGIDLKFGRGDIVYASYVDPLTDKRHINHQGGLYLGAAVARYDILGITDDWKAIFAISQPRANHYDSHDMTVGELRAWVAAQAPAANEALTLWLSPHLITDARLNPGEKQCRWCPLSGNCSAQTSKILDRFPKGHAAEAMPTLTQLDDVQVAQCLDLADEVEHWVKAVRGEALARALQGHVIPNWKIVTGRRGNRELPEDVDNTRVDLDVAALTEIGVEEADEPTQLAIKDAIHFALGDGAYKPRTLKTVTQLQKSLEKKAPLLWAALQAHITQADGKPSLERMEDPRPPMAIVSQEFPTAEPGKGATGLL